MSALTNGRYNVPIPLVYIDEPMPRERRPNRPARPVRMIRKVRDWR